MLASFIIEPRILTHFSPIAHTISYVGVLCKLDICHTPAIKEVSQILTYVVIEKIEMVRCDCRLTKLLHHMTYCHNIIIYTYVYVYRQINVVIMSCSYRIYPSHSFSSTSTEFLLSVCFALVQERELSWERI